MRTHDMPADDAERERFIRQNVGNLYKLAALASSGSSRSVSVANGDLATTSSTYRGIENVVVLSIYSEGYKDWAVVRKT